MSYRHKICSLLTSLSFDSDLWQLPSARLTANVTDRIETNFFQRCPPDQRPRHLRQKLRQFWEAEVTDAIPEQDNDNDSAYEGSSDTQKTDEKKSFNRKKNIEPKYDSSLLQAIYITFKAEWWTSGMLKLISGYPNFLILCLRSQTFPNSISSFRYTQDHDPSRQ